MRAFLKFASWPALAGLLLALFILQRWVWVDSPRGDGTLVSKAPAAGQWAPDGKTLFIRGGRLVSPALAELQRKSYTLRSGEQTDYAFGIRIGDHRGVRMLYHGGTDYDLG